ncbi:DsrE family protein [Lutibacter sp.]
MKKIMLLVLLFSLTKINAQNTDVKMGPIIENYGKVFQIANPELLLKTDKVYNVIFDIYTDKSEGNSVNPLLNTVARYLNMHAQQGVPLKNMNVVIVLHGAATKNALNDSSYQKHFKISNPNTALIEALTKANAKLFVCGQSYVAHKYQMNEKSTQVKLALSALTVLIEYQTNGYQLITFN